MGCAAERWSYRCITLSAQFEHECLFTRQRQSCGGSLLDSADSGVAVFHRKRIIARHKGRAHAYEFAFWHSPAKHERLGAAAEPAIECPHAHLVRSGWREMLLPDLGFSAAGIPER